MASQVHDQFPLGIHARWALGGAVVSPHYLASTAGAEMLRRGGSAVDAIIAANAVLGVVYPHMCGIGGDAFVLIQKDGDTPADCLNASGWSSILADPNKLRAQGLSEMPVLGGASVTVPGVVDGWGQLSQRFGKLAFGDLLEPAIRHAEGGFPVTRRLRDWIVEATGVLKQEPWLAKRFLVKGEPPAEGSVVHQPELAETFRKLRDHGPRSFYEGDIAADIVQAVTSHGGWQTLSDLAEFYARWDSPLTLRQGGITIQVPPPNSQGVVLLWMLAEVLAHHSRGAIANARSLLRAKRRAYTLRDRTLTDPDYMSVSRDELVDFGKPLGKRVLGGPPGGDTVYLAAWDSSGMLVSMIQSIFYAFGSAVVVPERGIILQNRGAYFSLDDRSINVLAPRKRTLHTLMCALMSDAQRGERIAVGSMGGDAQPQILSQLVAHWLSGMDWETALRQPRWTHGPVDIGDPPDKIIYETRMSRDAVAYLEKEGQASPIGPWAQELGHAHVISVRGEVALAGTDPRSDGSVGLP